MFLAHIFKDKKRVIINLLTNLNDIELKNKTKNYSQIFEQSGTSNEFFYDKSQNVIENIIYEFIDIF